MHQMYLEMYPDDNCSRESYRQSFVKKFNISFGYPRKDTCSSCDEFNIKLQCTELPVEEMAKLHVDKELHLRKAQIFYDRKAKARQDAQSSFSTAAMAFDYAKNLPCPNITTDDAYYRRKLSVYSFNIHDLGSDNVFLYAYDKTIGRKGSDEVTSMLYDYFFNMLPPGVTHLELFCDSCAGQNKNWTMLRFLHYMVHNRKRFVNIKISFPIRGHSYLECDRDMASINQKARVDTPSGWFEVFRTSRKTPSPFSVIEIHQDKFLNITEHIKIHHRATCPVPIRPLCEVQFSSEHPRMMHYRENWNGIFATAVISKPVGKRSLAKEVPLVALYREPLLISKAKYSDLQVLKRFCNTEGKTFFNNLACGGGDAARDSSSESSELDD